MVEPVIPSHTKASEMLVILITFCYDSVIFQLYYSYSCHSECYYALGGSTEGFTCWEASG